MTRFCTSRSLNTRITSRRSLSKLRNSTCRNADWSRRGKVTTQVSSVMRESIRDTASIISDGGKSGFTPFSKERCSASSSGSTASMLSTKKRRPWLVGTLPAEVCGDLTSPWLSKRDMMLRTVAALTDTLGCPAKALEATGRPLVM